MPTAPNVVVFRRPNRHTGIGWLTWAVCRNAWRTLICLLPGMQLVDEAYQRWLTEEEGVVDDITAVVVRFLH